MATNEEIFDAVKTLDGKVDGLVVSVARLETWKETHEKRANCHQKYINGLRDRINLQGIVVGMGEVIIALIAIFRGGGS